MSRPFALEFPRVSRRLRVHYSYAAEDRRKLRRYRIRAHASFLAILLGAGLLLGATGTEHLPTMIGGGTVGLLLLGLGLAGMQES